MTRPKSLLLTVIALAGAALLLAWSQDWFLVRLAGAEHPVGGDVAAGAVAALALTAFALVAALALAGPVFRVVLGALTALVGGTAVLVALFVLGGFVEHPLGSARTLCVMAASGVGGMWIAGIAGSTPVVGVSGIVFGLVGAIGGHLIMGVGFSMMSVFGVVALSGVVVNSSLVLVHHVNQRRDQGVPLAEAVRDAGVARFRPILLTSLTTFAGLSPILFERNMGAQFLVPMATSLAFGVAFATAISLFLLPAGYMILEDLRHWVFGPPAPPPLEVVEGAVQETAGGAGIARIGDPRH